MKIVCTSTFMLLSHRVVAAAAVHLKVSYSFSTTFYCFFSSSSRVYTLNVCAFNSPKCIRLSSLVSRLSRSQSLQAWGEMWKRKWWSSECELPLLISRPHSWVLRHKKRWKKLWPLECHYYCHCEATVVSSRSPLAQNFEESHCSFAFDVFFTLHRVKVL